MENPTTYDNNITIELTEENIGSETSETVAKKFKPTHDNNNNKWVDK